MSKVIRLSGELFDRLNRLPQFMDGEELIIAKNDPKNGEADYWWAAYGEIHLSGYYSLKKLLKDLDKECKEYGYHDQP